MATYTQASLHHAPQRGVAMALALIAAVVLSPLYVSSKQEIRYYEMKLSSGFVLPMVLAGLIIAIRTTSSMENGGRAWLSPSPDPAWVLRIGGSSWGLAAILVMLMLVLSWQESVKEFFWR
ncbi:hypothetical protein F3Y22_tig00110187pilonHSYRG00562 [Hibiscus syriacus]|uniref:Uncharacterized protein n=1 Tax=Hibiscus syriacus TaxID=106335 RepID=A0A6A3BJW4_HIBSY|nr:hypothetical protein F3Y22_tig00110187pilonHSYRG00562 [Hibiscus syriacus]